MKNQVEVLEYAKRAFIEEHYSAKIYEHLAHAFKDNKSVSSKFKEIAQMERIHAKLWSFFKKRGVYMEGFHVNKSLLRLKVFNIDYSVLR